MLGTRRFSPGSAAACMAMAVLAMACNPDSATTGPSGLNGKDFAANLRLLAGDQQVGAIGSALTQPLIVRVVDAGGQPVAGATVTFSVRQGGGSVNPAANISGPDGTVTANWTMGTSLGPNKAVALLSNQFLLDSAVFTATATTGPANRFTKVSGDSQTAMAGQQLAAPLVVKVQDAFGNNLSGVKVTWTPSLLNGSVSFAADTTAADGTASATWRLGTGATGQNLVASVAGVATTINFFATATPDLSGSSVLTFAVTGGQGQTGTGGATLTTALSVRVTDQFGNAIPNQDITWGDLIVGGGSVSPATSVTSATGTASTTWTLGRRPGTQTVRSKLTGRTETQTFTASATVSLTDVNVGNFSSCGIASDGTAMCWGYGADGQLGKGANLNNTNQITTSVSTGDTLAGPFLTFRTTSVGKNHACGITIGRDLYCWGSNNVLQLGAGAAGGTPSKWKADQAWGLSAAGELNTCAITPTGVLYCSGANDQGQMGSGGAFGAPSPAVLAGIGGLAAGNRYSTVSVGLAHVCAIEQFDGTAASRVPWCWGNNTNGQLGAGVSGASSSTPAQVTLPFGVTAFDSTSLVSGNLHTCALADHAPGVGATAYCWGGNAFGQLGDGTQVDRAVPTAVASQAFVQLSAGAFHTCGLTAAGVAYCWGRNGSGQLGDGTRTDGVGGPVAVSSPGTTFRSISAGELFTCGVEGVPLAISGGTSSTPAFVRCWGDNEYGQLGNTTLPRANNQPTLTPTRMSFVVP
jgi:alpha-tubulin suppressor-like RCC1 family protein